MGVCFWFPFGGTSKKPPKGTPSCSGSCFETRPWGDAFGKGKKETRRWPEGPIQPPASAHVEAPPEKKFKQKNTTYERDLVWRTQQHVTPLIQ